MKYTLNIEDSTTNLTVASVVEKMVKTILNNTNNFVVEIHPVDKKIEFKQKGKIEKTKIIPKDLLNDSTLLQMEIKEDIEDKIGSVAFSVTEMIVEYWLKFNATYFYIEVFVEGSLLKIFFNVPFSKKRKEVYWDKDSFDGYNVEGAFFKGEWLKPDHKDGLGGGKRA